MKDGLNVKGRAALAGTAFAALFFAATAAFPPRAAAGEWPNIPDNAAFDEILAEAKETGKPIFLNFYADWCKPCARLESVTYRDQKVIDALDGYVKVNVNSGTEEGSAVGSRYGFSYTPLIVFADSQGEQVNRVFGYLPPGEFLEQIAKSDAALAGKGKAVTELIDDYSVEEEKGLNKDARIAMGAAGFLSFFCLGGMINFFVKHGRRD